ncbi:DPP IV N-terminal domain-containing protein [Nocardia sp. NPDC088792]|uniref:S9 family peptidase n=1 Tax=Nocardia sp. NPDC088792 TaxID=3364332 RepID=UPI0037F5600E
MATVVPESAYRTAEKLLGHNRSELVYGAEVTPVRIVGEERFWYRSRTADGIRYVLVDPAAGRREVAFDHEWLAAVLGAASGEKLDPALLPLSALAFPGGAVEFDALGTRWRCTLDTGECERLAARPRSPLEVPSPDGTSLVFRRGDDLWVRCDDGSGERALTSDGVPDYGYGAEPGPFVPLVLLRALGVPQLPPSVVWSPDSTRVLTIRTDEREVATMHLVEAMPPDGGRPALLTLPYSVPGEEVTARGELVVLDVRSGTMVTAQAEPLRMSYITPIALRQAWWDRDGSAVYWLDHSRDQRTLRLQRLDPETGAVRTLIEESGPTRVEPAQEIAAPPIVRVLPGGHEVLWFSQRDGWGHLYLYDTRTDAPPVQVTSGAWVVRQILHVDEDRRVVYFLASGLIATDPYRRQVCRANLDGSGFARLCDDDLDHVVTVPENAAYFLDSASTTELPPVITVRDWDGAVLVELERADVVRLRDTGWRPPERFRTTAADATTDIYGVLYLPHDFDPGRRYPVIDHIYPGPQIHRVAPSFDPGSYGYDAEALAALGFVVVALDGRGTPGRDKAFHDASYGRLCDAGGLDDHIAAIRELAATRPWMDLDRVGIFGISGGGYATVRALCTYPDFYTVGVSESGNHDQRIYHQVWGESYDGPYDAEIYRRSANPEFADRLRGKLLLVHGELDHNVTPQQTLRLVARLVAADKDFEMLLVPGADHAFTGAEHYVIRRRWDFLVRHLLGAEPPAGFRLTPVPIEKSMAAMSFR